MPSVAVVGDAGASCSAGPEVSPRPRNAAATAWHVLLRRSYDVDAQVCARCGDRMRVIAVIHDVANSLGAAYVNGQPVAATQNSTGKAAIDLIEENVKVFEGETAGNYASEMLSASYNDTFEGYTVTSDNGSGYTTDSYTNTSPPRRTEEYGCMDVMGCESDCTSLGRLLSDTDACTAGMLDDMAKAAGLPVDEVTTGRERVTYPRPPGFDVETHNMGGCFDTGYDRETGICGLVLCVSELGSPSGASCSCGPGSTMSLTTLCTTVRCADGTLPSNTTCECVPPDRIEELPGGGPIPHPSGWPHWDVSTTLDMCASDDGFITYDYASDRGRSQAMTASPSGTERFECSRSFWHHCSGSPARPRRRRSSR